MQQAQFYIEHLGADFSDYLLEHQHYRDAADQAETALREVARVQRLERKFLPNFVFGPTDNVVVLGQDGLVANTLKYLDGQRVVGVNPDPARWEGVLLPFKVEDLARLMPEELQRKRQVKTVTLAQAVLNNGQMMHAVNDPLHRPAQPRLGPLSYRHRRPGRTAFIERRDRFHWPRLDRLVEKHLCRLDGNGPHTIPRKPCPPAPAPSRGMPISCTITCANPIPATPPKRTW